MGFDGDVLRRTEDRDMGGGLRRVTGPVVTRRNVKKESGRGKSDLERKEMKKGRTPRFLGNNVIIYDYRYRLPSVYIPYGVISFI